MSRRSAERLKEAVMSMATIDRFTRTKERTRNVVSPEGRAN
ncbi:MAG: hypothetical protein Q7U12_03960 [Undibacterium sp.]|nr:hypothetical protein [Undibacterium sp.]